MGAFRTILFSSVMLCAWLHLTHAYMEEGNIIAIRCADHYERHGELKSTNICVHGAGINQCGKLACYKGLNESCGEKLATGRCASNLMCCNGVCIGCLQGRCNQGDCRDKRTYMQSLYDMYLNNNNLDK